MSDIIELREKQNGILATAQSYLDESGKDGVDATRAKELEDQYDKAMAEYDAIGKRVEKMEAIAERKKALEAVDTSRRPAGEDRAAKGETPTEVTHASAFNNFLRHGMAELSPEERAIMRSHEDRAQSVGTASAGGYLVPGEFYNELVKSLLPWGPMLDPGVTRVIETATGAALTFPTANDTANKGALIAENTQVTTADVAFGTKTIDAFKYTTGLHLVSQELLQDSVLNIDALIRDFAAERLGRAVNEHLTVGDGSSKPNGIVTAAGTKAATAAAAISFDDLIELEHSVNAAYRASPSVRWMFNDSTVKALRKIKDSEGRYIWQPGDVKGGYPNTILGYQYIINEAMPSVAASQKSVLFGDLSKYLVRRVREFSLRRLVERYADYDQVGFVGFGRYDGDLLDAGAVKVLAHPAT